MLGRRAQKDRFGDSVTLAAIRTPIGTGRGRVQHGLNRLLYGVRRKGIAGKRHRLSVHKIHFVSGGLALNVQYCEGTLISNLGIRRCLANHDGQESKQCSAIQGECFRRN